MVSKEQFTDIDRIKVKKIEQGFYCKHCKQLFKIEKSEYYWNYKCPVCGDICMKENYITPIFNGLPTKKFFK